MRKIILTFVFCASFVLSIMAQTTITGQVTDEFGNGLPGVSVVEKGTLSGTTTDIDGKFKLNASSGNAVLQFSFVGMMPKEIPVAGQTTVNITMSEDIEALDEVVVTALGIKRKEKTLTYAQQTIKSDELIKARDVDVVSSMNGKIAGLEIENSSSGPGGSKKITLRGNKSINSIGEPLFVIDGIPMINNKGAQPGMWGGVDEGDGLSQLNPDDIESITVLKGANASILYGSQGVDGVVVITTKKGKKGTTQVKINSGITFESVTNIPDLQFKYGSVKGAKESWSTTPGNYPNNFVDDFFETGYNLINSVSVGGGNEKTTAYVSYANTTAQGIYPNNKYVRNLFSFRQATKLFEDKITVTSNVMLTHEKTNNRAPAGYYLNPLTGLYFFPRDRDFSFYKNNYKVFSKERNMYLQNWIVSDHLQSNPYWIVNKQPKTDLTKRVIGNITINYDIKENLSFQVRGNYDYAVKKFEQQHAAGSNSTNVHQNGRWDYKKYDDELIYVDGILRYTKDIDDFGLNAMVGANYERSVFGRGVNVNSGTDGLLFANEFYFQNLSRNVQVQSIIASRRIKKAFLGTLELSYKNILFLDFSGRQDWSSTLAETGNESYFYPAIGLTSILSEMLTMPEYVNFAKLRVSFATVGNDVPYNRVAPEHTIGKKRKLAPNADEPFENLKPELTENFEIGTDWRFFNGRLGFDLTYYHIWSFRQYIELTAPSASIFTKYFVNAGEITNKGVELSIKAIPIKTNNLSWETTFNASRNINKIVKLHPDLDGRIEIGQSEGYDSKIVEGGQIGDVYVYKFQRDDEGRIILDDNTGRPLKTATTELIGNTDPDWLLSWSNTLHYKSFALSFLINGKFGGVTVSQTEAMLDGFGVSQRTADARDNGFVSINAVQNSQKVTQIDPYLYYTTTGGRNGIKEPYTYKRDNIRLSQLVLSYNFNVEKLNLPMRNAIISLIGRNLFYFHKKAPYDSESALSTNRSFQSLDNFNLPATRSYGINLSVTF